MSEHDGHEEIYLGSWWRFGPLLRALAGGLLLAVVFVLERAGVVEGIAAAVLYGASAVVSASHWGVEAVESVLHRRISIDVLMGVATVGSAVLGLWGEAAFLAFLYGAAEGLEEWTYDRTRGSIRSLLDLAPKQARLVDDGVETMVAAVEVAPGDRFVVLPGESLPTDGVIRLRDHQPGRGGGDRRVDASGQDDGESGVCRDGEPDRTGRGAGHNWLRGQHSGSDHPSGGGGPGGEDSGPAADRPVR